MAGEVNESPSLLPHLQSQRLKKTGPYKGVILSSPLEFTYDATITEREKLKTYGVMIHKLKSPLTAIRGYAEGIQARFFTMTPDEVLAKVERIVDWVDEAYNIIRSDLEVIKGEFQGWECECTPHNLNPLLLGVVDDLSLLYRNIKADAVLLTDPSVCVDVKVFSIIMQHLVENAHQHGNKAKPIVIHVEELPNLVAIKVINWGPYKTEALLQNLDDSVAFDEQAQGSGLGLYIVKQYAEKMGGSLTGNQVDDGDGEVRTVLTVWLRKVGPLMEDVTIGNQDEGSSSGRQRVHS